MNELKTGLIASILLHGAFLYIIATGLPYFSRDLPTPERPVPVEIVDIDDITRVKETEPKPEPEPEPVRQAVRDEPVRPEPPREAIPNPDLKPKPKPDQDEIERKKLVASVTPKAKPRPPTSFDAGQIAALIDKSIKEQPKPENTREEDLKEAVDRSLAAGVQSRQATASIEDFIRARMRDCWSLPAGAKNIQDMKVVISLSLNPDGYLASQPKIRNSGAIFRSGNEAYRAFAESAARAVRLCEPYELPKEHYNLWKELELNFDPSDMVG